MVIRGQFSLGKLLQCAWDEAPPVGTTLRRSLVEVVVLQLVVQLVFLDQVRPLEDDEALEHVFDGTHRGAETVALPLGPLLDWLKMKNPAAGGQLARLPPRCFLVDGRTRGD